MKLDNLLNKDLLGKQFKYLTLGSALSGQRGRQVVNGGEGGEQVNSRVELGKG